MNCAFQFKELLTYKLSDVTVCQVLLALNIPWNVSLLIRVFYCCFCVISFLICNKNAGSWRVGSWQFGCFAGIITTSGRMIGERLSASGTRLNTTSPVQSAFHGNKSSTESVPRSSTGGLKSVSRQSLLDIVSCRLGVGRNKQQQQHQVRTSGQFALVTQKIFLCSLKQPFHFYTEATFRNERDDKIVKEKKIISSVHMLVEVAFLPVSLPQRICVLDSVFM